MLLGAAILGIAVVALMGAFVGQSFLVASARGLQTSMSDATRIMEQIRQQNVGCGLPFATPPDGYTHWDVWLAAQAGGKSLGNAEVIAVTCQDEDGGTTSWDYCGPNQIGEEWVRAGEDTAHDPIRITVAVGYRVKSRVVGGTSTGPEFTYEGSTEASPGAADAGGSGASTSGGGAGRSSVEMSLVCQDKDGETVAEKLCRSSLIERECGCLEQRTFGLLGGSGGAGTEASGQAASGAAAGGETPAFVWGPDLDADGVIESQAMLTTVMTCR